MTTISIPTADELESRLSGIDRLLTATKWEKAAIVWAFTIKKGSDEDEDEDDEDDGEVGGSNLTHPHFPCGIREFARLRYSGLSSRATVRFYRKQWEDAIKGGEAKPTAPGEDGVELPDLDWPASPRTQTRDNQTDAEELKAAAEEAGIKSTTVLDIASNKVALGVAIKGSPEVYEAAKDAVQQVSALRGAGKARSMTIAQAVAKNPKAVLKAITADPELARAIASDDKARHEVEEAHYEQVKERVTLGTPRTDLRAEQFKGFMEILSDFDRLDRTFPHLLKALKDLPLEQVQPAFQGRAQRIEKWAHTLRDLLDGDPEFQNELNELLSSEN